MLLASACRWTPYIKYWEQWLTHGAKTFFHSWRETYQQLEREQSFLLLGYPTSGMISKEHLVGALRQLGVSVNRVELEEIMNHYSTPGACGLSQDCARPSTLRPWTPQHPVDKAGMGHAGFLRAGVYRPESPYSRVAVVVPRGMVLTSYISQGGAH